MSKKEFYVWDAENANGSTFLIRAASKDEANKIAVEIWCDMSEGQLSKKDMLSIARKQITKIDLSKGNRWCIYEAD